MSHKKKINTISQSGFEAFQTPLSRSPDYFSEEKIEQEARWPDFVWPKISRFLSSKSSWGEYLVRMAIHAFWQSTEKRDLLTSVGFSRSKKTLYVESLQTTMEQLHKMLQKCGEECHDSKSQRDKCIKEKESRLRINHTKSHFMLNHRVSLNFTTMLDSLLSQDPAP